MSVLVCPYFTVKYIICFFFKCKHIIYLQVWMFNEISEECWNLSVWIVSLAAIDAQSKRLPGWRGSDL